MSETSDDNLVINVGETRIQGFIEKPSPENARWQGVEGRRDNHDVYFHQEPLRQLLVDLKNRGSLNEAAGVTIGSRCRDSRTGRTFTEIIKYVSLPNNLVRAERARITITPNAWAYANEQRDRLNDPNLELVSWVHTHPGYGIFLSADDDAVNEHIPLPGQLAIVFDPTANEKGSLGIFSQGGAAEPQEVNGKRVKFTHNFSLHRGYYIIPDTNDEPVIKITAEELQQEPEIVIRPEDIDEKIEDQTKIIKPNQPQISITKEELHGEGRFGAFKKLFRK